MAAQAEDRSAEIDVFAAGQLGMEPGADLDERREAAADRDLAGGGCRNPAEQLQNCALARAVAPDDPQRLASRHVEAHVAHCPEILARRCDRTRQTPAIASAAAGERHTVALGDAIAAEIDH